jgi:DNA-binding beta-propeller fold protein YncE
MRTPWLLIFLIMLTLFNATFGSENDASKRPITEDIVTTYPVSAKSRSIGGVAVDGIGYIYIADFGETVWRVTPQGEVEKFATGLYGASGNAIDAQGNLLQSNFSGNFISKISRTGDVSTFATGLSGPVGIAIDKDGNLFVCNCRGNNIAKVTPEGIVSEFVSTSPWLRCPNGITFDAAGNVYVVGFFGQTVIKITPEAEVSRFATVPELGTGHISFAGGNFYVTNFRTHKIHRISQDGEVSVFAGTGVRGAKAGRPLEAQFSNPNGIAASSNGLILYVNSFMAPWNNGGRGQAPSPLTLHQIDLVSLREIMRNTFATKGINSAIKAYRRYKDDPAHSHLNTEVPMNQLGYLLLWEGQQEEAVTIFKLNTESYPDSWNAFDSLADGYMRSGKTELAIQNYEKSLAMNPDNANAASKLKELRSETTSK